MIQLLKLPAKTRKNIIEQASNKKGLPPSSVEKDWWVTLTLKAVFETEIAPYICFKGGTSLSKCWGLIDRFSEDIDLAVDKQYLNFTRDESEFTTTMIQNLKKKGCKFTSTIFKQSIENKLIEMGVPTDMFTLAPEEVHPKHPDKDPQRLLLTYETLFEENPYLPSNIKIEVSARSTIYSSSERKVESFVCGAFPGKDFAGEPFNVRTVDPMQTFLEKIFLLHEEFTKTPLTEIRIKRMSRHMYDLEKLMDTVHGKEAILNAELFKKIVNHRTMFNHLKGVTYKTHTPAGLIIIPPEALIKEYEKDYNTMKETMFYTDSHSFNSLIERINILVERIRAIRP